MENTYCIYMHIAPNGKVYIGQTCKKPEHRWGKDGKGYSGNEYFYRAIQKYGWDNFKHFIIIKNISQDEANYQEEFLIKYYDSTNPDKGYNIALGGLNCLLAEETKKKMSEARKGEKNPMYGKIHSEETKQKMREARKLQTPPMRGKHHSEEIKKKMSESKKGENNPNYGKHHTFSEETKLKMSEAKKKYWKNKKLEENKDETF